MSENRAQSPTGKLAVKKICNCYKLIDVLKRSMVAVKIAELYM